MGKQETGIQNKIRLAIARLSIMFRINVGMAWTGNKITHNPGGSITIHDPRPFKTGVPKGFPDLFGWTQVEITPEMVGKRLAVFTMVEVKTLTGRVSTEQQNAIDVLNASGGIAGVARSSDGAIQLIEDSKKRFSE